jgi:heme/copper-type cytochrome/quinol oxidase subunit 2
MTRLHPRPAAAVGTLLCALGTTYVMSGLSLHGDASSSPEGRRESSASSAREEFQEPNVHAVTVVASRYRFSPATIEVFQNDVVKVDLRTEDIAHSFTIDAYRIAKRVSPEHSVSFEFRADQPGTFPIYCNLQLDNGCRQMKAQLIVKPRK